LLPRERTAGESESGRIGRLRIKADGLTDVAAHDMALDGEHPAWLDRRRLDGLAVGS
jgi:hypothetical protein